ncbi:Cytochrome P450 [Corchorus olitorius]|uniref:Cytochrome P450 n=1 Tax=Corchorus olitorius TaxID=93759 RepID=A0A1R3KS00_9ROSI|nr:Cytochrome P450 [Corchorus olitorius]
MADKFGPIYSLKLGQHRVLVVSSWEIAKDCFTTNDKTLATRASIAAGKHIGYNNAIFALAPYGEYWRTIRKIATIELFSTHRLEKLKHIRLSEMDLFIKEMFQLCAGRAENWAQVTMSEVLERLTFNVSLRTLVGKRFSSSSYAQVNSEPWRYEKAIKQALYLSGIFILADALPYLEWLDIQGHVRSMKKTAKEIDSVISVWLEDHLRRRKESQGSCESDFMDVMLANLADDADTGREASGYGGRPGACLTQDEPSRGCPLATSPRGPL